MELSTLIIDTFYRNLLLIIIIILNYHSSMRLLIRLKKSKLVIIDLNRFEKFSNIKLVGDFFLLF